MYHEKGDLNMMNITSHAIHPSVIEKIGSQERHYDIYSRLLKERIIFVLGEVNDTMANSIVAQLLYLNAEDSKADIYMYINSPGGSVTAGLSIYDTMRHIDATIHTICIGQACSMGAFLLSAGDKRSSLGRSRIMIHQPLGGFQGQASDIEIHAKEMKRIKRLLTEVLAANTGRPYKEVKKACDRDNFLSAEEALAFGIIDEVIEQKETSDNPLKRRPFVPSLNAKKKKVEEVLEVKPELTPAPKTKPERKPPTKKAD